MERSHGVGREALRQWVAESRAAQGLPPTIEDPATIEKVARIFRLAEQAQKQAS